jgi:hypothetical protein
MDDKTFAYELASWLDPYMLLQCVKRYEIEREKALARTSLVIGSDELIDGEDAGFPELVAAFLRGFRMPRPIIELLRATQDASQISAETWNWLENVELSSARYKVCSREHVQANLPPHAILLIEERDAIADVIQGPVLALLDIVVMLADHWRKMANLGARIYYEHNMPTPFYAYIDLRVAESYLTLEDSTFNGIAGAKLRYRAVTVYGSPAPESPIWEASRESARFMAASTHMPIVEGHQ